MSSSTPLPQPKEPKDKEKPPQKPKPDLIKSLDPKEKQASVSCPYVFDHPLSSWEEGHASI